MKSQVKELQGENKNMNKMNTMTTKKKSSRINKNNGKRKGHQTNIRDR